MNTLEKIASKAYSTTHTCMNSFSIGAAVERNRIKGNIVECGLGAGSNFAMMYYGVMSSNQNSHRFFIGFDSFEGIQLAGPKDTEQAGIGKITHDVNVPLCELLKSSGITKHSQSEVEANLREWGIDMNRVYLVKGWVQNTIPETAIDKIAVLRLDMDIYDPTLFALRQLYDKVSSGGYVIIDDWALTGVRRAVEEFWQEAGINPDIQTIENSTPIYWVKE